MVNSTLSSFILQESHRNHKRTWQGVSNILLSCLYKEYMVYANNKYSYSKVYIVCKSTTLLS